MAAGISTATLILKPSIGPRAPSSTQKNSSLVAIVSPNFSNAEWKLLDDVIDEVYGVCLRVFLIDLESANSGCIVDCSVLEPAHLLAAFSFEGQELDVYLDVVTSNLFLISLGVQLT